MRPGRVSIPQRGEPSCSCAAPHSLRVGALRVLCALYRDVTRTSSSEESTGVILIRMFARLAAAACALIATAAQAGDWSLLLQSDRHSDFSSIADLRDDNAAGYRARGAHNLAYLHDEARLQRSAGPWSIALLARANATLVANRDAIDALRLARGMGRDANDRHDASVNTERPNEDFQGIRVFVVADGVIRRGHYVLMRDIRAANGGALAWELSYAPGGPVVPGVPAAEVGR